MSIESCEANTSRESHRLRLLVVKRRARASSSARSRKKFRDNVWGRRIVNNHVVGRAFADRINRHATRPSIARSFVGDLQKLRSELRLARNQDF